MPREFRSCHKDEGATACHAQFISIVTNSATLPPILTVP
jgi:hypothetical protein